MIKLILLTAPLVGCATDAEFHESLREENRQYLGERALNYYHDKSTGLCFVANNLRYNNGVLTHVPCTEAVMARVEFVGTFPAGEAP